MEHMQGEPNGKTKPPAERLVSEPTPKPSDHVAGARPMEGTFARPLPLGKVSSMAERPREREPVTAHSKPGFFVDAEALFKMVGIVLAIAAAWYSLKSDLRDMNTKMDVQAAQMREMKAEQKLQQLDIKDVQLALARAGILGSTPQITIDGRPPQERSNP